VELRLVVWFGGETESGAVKMVTLEAVPWAPELLFELLPEFQQGLAASVAA